jgi:hypothetical protein
LKTSRIAEPSSDSICRFVIKYGRDRVSVHKTCHNGEREVPLFGLASRSQQLKSKFGEGYTLTCQIAKEELTPQEVVDKGTWVITKLLHFNDCLTKGELMGC